MLTSGEDEQLMNDSVSIPEPPAQPVWSLGVANKILNLDREVLGARFQRSVRQMLPEVVPDPKHQYSH